MQSFAFPIFPGTDITVQIPDNIRDTEFIARLVFPELIRGQKILILTPLTTITDCISDTLVRIADRELPGADILREKTAHIRIGETGQLQVHTASENSWGYVADILVLVDDLHFSAKQQRTVDGYIRTQTIVRVRRKN